MASGKSNYQAWKFRIIRILKEKGLLTAIETDVDKGNSKDLARDNAAFTILTLNVKDSQITHIQECATAKEAWEALRIVHQGIGASGRMVLMQRLWALRMVEGDDMAEHLNKFRELANQVESLSADSKGIENNELVTPLSLSLPESYEPIIMTLQSRADEITFDIFSGRLLQESARRQVVQTTSPSLGQSTSVTAFAARSYGRGRGGGRYGGARGGMRIQHIFGRPASADSTGKSGGTPSKGRGKCFYCQKEGHWKRDCYKWKANEAKEGGQISRGEQTGLAFTIQEGMTMVIHQHNWIIDSGASQHLCSNKDSFQEGTYREIRQKAIEIADGSKIAAIGMGNVSIGQLCLSDVLHVPQAGGNLISVGRLIDSGYNVSFGSKMCTISKQALSLKGERQGNLYCLRKLKNHDSAHLGLATNKSVPETAEVWHRRLGHRTLDTGSISYLKSRVSDFEIKGNTGERDERKICKTCAIGHQHKEPMTGSRGKAVELLEVVHSDICGPMQVSTINGERYFITFIDSKSGRIAVTLLKAKGDALGAFQAYKARAEKEAGREIKNLRTDGGGEFIGRHFKSYLRICGIVHSVSPPYTPSHNGLAERANRTLMEAARCMIANTNLEKSFWGFAVATAAHIHNRLPSRSHEDQSPLEFWTGRIPSIGHLRIFGSVTHTLIPKEQRKKLDERSKKCILIGYDENAGSKVYRLFNPATKTVHSSRDIIVKEQESSSPSTLEYETTCQIEFAPQYAEESESNNEEGERERGTEETLPIETRSDQPDQEEFGGDTIIVKPPAELVKARKEKVSRQQTRGSEQQQNLGQHFSAQPWRAMIAHTEEPQTLKEALSSEDSEK